MEGLVWFLIEAAVALARHFDRECVLWNLDQAVQIMAACVARTAERRAEPSVRTTKSAPARYVAALRALVKPESTTSTTESVAHPG